MKYMAMFMAFLAYLSHFQQYASRLKQRSDRQAGKIKAFHDKILAKSAKVYVYRALFILFSRLHARAERFDLFERQQTQLPVPGAGMGVAGYPMLHDKAGLRDRVFLRTFLFADAYSVNPAHN
jgi:hypothetical protein